MYLSYLKLQVLIDGYLKSMLHLCRCGDVNCEFPNCKKLRSVVKHTGTCEKKISGGCLICSQFFQLNCLHSHQCEDSNCPIPNCKRLKETLGDRLAERISQRQSQQGQLTYVSDSTLFLFYFIMNKIDWIFTYLFALLQEQ